jgi:hypothetical protein
MMAVNRDLPKHPIDLIDIELAGGSGGFFGAGLDLGEDLAVTRTSALVWLDL